LRIEWRVWGTVLFLVTMHFVLHTGLGMGSAAPDLLIVALLILAREVPLGPGAGAGFALGLLEDAFSALAFGANAMALTVVGALAARTRDLFVGDSRFFLPAYFFGGTLLHELVYWMAAGEAVREPFVQSLLVEAPIAALYAALVGSVVAIITGAGWRLA
jgi:rod shape-determining protein MreD